MQEQQIQAFRPNVSREEAVRVFQTINLESLLRYAFSGPLRSVADVYIPFLVFRTTLTNAGSSTTRFYALEAVEGSLELFEFEQEPVQELVVLSSRNLLPLRLDPSSAREILLSKVRRIVFRQGFFRIRDIHMEADLLANKIWMPYWVGFFGRGNEAHIGVLDAVRRRLEGGKARQLVKTWLIASQEDVAELSPTRP